MQTNNSREVHPLVEGIFPPLTETAAVELAEDIIKNGQHEPIVLFEKKILDGKNRYDACIAAKIKPKIISYETLSQFVNDGLHPIDYVMSANFFRRDLTTSQRAVAKVESEKRRQLPVYSYEELCKRTTSSYKEREHKEATKAVGVVEPISSRGNKPRVMAKTLDEMAKEAGVGKTIIHRTIQIAKRAPGKLKAIKEGKKTVAQAFKELPLTKKQKQAREERVKRMTAGLTRNDTINALIKRAQRNDGSIYVEIAGFGIRCAIICRVEQN
jgi:hypothetical protein